MSRGSATRTILIVEDEALLAMRTTAILERNGYRVVHVLHGDAAMEAVDSGGIDLILMDIHLGPGRMDGTGVAERILGAHVLPVVFCTSDTDEETVARARRISRYGYVLKSAGEFALLESIRMAFELFQAIRPAAARADHSEISAGRGDTRNDRTDREGIYEDILESIGDAVISTDKRGNVTRMNRTARELIGCSDGEVLDKPLYAVFTLHDSENGALLPNPVETVLETGTTLTLSNHTRLVSRSGSERHIADSVAPIRDAAGEVRGAVLVFRDESEKYEQERLLREREAQYRRLFENMAEGFVRADAGGTIVLANQSAVELCGYDSVEDLVGRHMSELYVDPAARSVLLARLTEKGELRNHEFLLRQSNGDSIWTLCNIKLMVDEQGNVAGTEGLFRDYTDRKALALERERSARFLDSVFDAIEDPVMVLDSELRVRKANRAAGRMVADGQGVDGRLCHELFHGRTTPCVDCPTIRAFRTRRVHQCTKEIPDTGPAKQCYQLFAYPVVDETGSVDSVVEYARNITDLVKGREALRESTERFQSLFNNSSVMLVIDPETGEIVHANASALDFYGYSYETITSRRIQDINLASDDEVRRQMAAAASGSKTYFRFRHRIANGEIRDVDVYSGRVSWGDRSVLCSVIHDVTSKTEAETRLQASERRFRAVFDQAAAGIAVAASDGSIVEVNEQLCRYLGYSREELTRLNVDDISIADDISEEERRITSVLDGSCDSFNIEKRYRRKDGAVVWGDLSSQVVRDEHGTIEFVIGVVVDITARKGVEERLRTSESYYRNVLQFIPTFVLDRDFRYLQVNDLAAELVHTTADELLGRRITDLFPGFEQTEFYRLYTQVMHSQQSASTTAQFTLPDGTSGYYQVHVLPCPDGIQCVAVDVTEEKAAQETLRVALRESENTKRIVTNSPVCVFTWRNEEGWPADYVSENVDTVLGYAAKEFVAGGLQYRQLIHPDDRPRVDEEVRTHLADRTEVFSQEYRLITRDGGVRWVEDRSCVELTEAGVPALIHGLVWDITPRKETQLLVRKQRRYERSLAQVSAILLSAESETGALRAALATLQRVAQVSRAYIFENFSDPDDGLCMRQTHEVCAPGVPPELGNPELQHVVYDEGFSRWRDRLRAGKAVTGNVSDFPEAERAVLEPQGIVSMLVLPLFVGGEWKGFVGFDDTSSAYRFSRSELQLLQTAADLIGAFVYRMESERTIRRQLQDKEVLIRETHHRIKNNIASIHGLLSLQAATVVNEEARAILGQAISRVNGMRDLYEKMLSAQDVRVLPVSPYLNDLIYSSVPFFAHQAAVTVERSIAGFTLDSERLLTLGIVVNELLTNAMKYAFRGRETGTISVRCQKDENRVTLIVQDDGIGLPEGFDAERSTGLGMSLVTMLSRQLDGSVTFENDHGTKVTLRFDA